MKLSLVIPARNEAAHLPHTISALAATLRRERIDAEMLIVDDHSSDDTPAVARALAAVHPSVHLLSHGGPAGFGFAVQSGLAAFTGDAVVIVMADGSDDPRDVVAYYAKLREGYDCVFGSRFIRGSRVVGYPPHKWLLNRLANGLIRLLFGLPHNDITNAFKGYHRSVIEGVQPLIARHFNLTVELPLKAIVRGYSYATVPIRWRQRQHGLSKLKIKEMGSRYLYIVLSVFLEKHLVRSDYQAHVRGEHVSRDALARERKVEKEPVAS